MKKHLALFLAVMFVVSMAPVVLAADGTEVPAPVLAPLTSTSWSVNNVQFHTGTSFSALRYDLVVGTVTGIGTGAGEFDMKAYAIGSGTTAPTKWTAFDGSANAINRFTKAITALPRKGGTLWIANEAISTTAPRVPPAGSQVRFSTIEPQERLRVAINYSNEVAGEYRWVPFNRAELKDNFDKTEHILTGIEYAYAPGITKIADVLAEDSAVVTIDGVSVSVGQWAAFPGIGAAATNGLPISNELRNEKPARATYFVRTAATITGLGTAEEKYFPPSTVARLGVAPMGRALNIRANFKTESIRLRAEQRFATGTSVATADFRVFTRAELQADKTLANLVISDNITSGDSVRVFAAATARRPASTVSSIPLAARGTAPVLADLGAAANGKPTLDKAFESRITIAGEGQTAIANPNTVKWGGAPRANNLATNTSIEVRRKANARFDRNAGDFGTTRAASETVVFRVKAMSPLEFEIVPVSP
jgi:hypothetical protein